MKNMKDMKHTVAHLIHYLEETMAQYVESQDRIRHIATLDWRFRV